VGLSACQPGFRILHTLHVSKSGFQLDEKPADSAAVRDSLKPFCADREKRRQWTLEGDTALTAADFVGFLQWVTSINNDCRGLFALGEGDPPVMMQPPIPAPRSLYAYAPSDSSKPRLTLMVVTTRSEVKFWTQDEWLPEIPVVVDKQGLEYVASGKKEAPVLTGWRDALGRCLVEARKARCTDSLWPKTKYVLLGDLSRLPDTVNPDSKKDMDWVSRGPILRDVMAAAEIHAYRTIPGAIPDFHPYYHGVFDPGLSWASTQRMIIALRHAGVDLNTIETLK